VFHIDGALLVLEALCVAASVLVALWPWATVAWLVAGAVAVAVLVVRPSASPATDVAAVGPAPAAMAPPSLDLDLEVVVVISFEPRLPAFVRFLALARSRGAERMTVSPRTIIGFAAAFAAAFAAVPFVLIAALLRPPFATLVASISSSSSKSPT